MHQFEFSRFEKDHQTAGYAHEIIWFRTKVYRKTDTKELFLKGCSKLRQANSSWSSLFTMMQCNKDLDP